MPLTGASARELRGLAHHLDPVVQVGKGGVTRAVVAQVAAALLDHELIKVKIGSEAPTDRKIAAGQLASRTASDVVQVIGRVVILYKPHPKKPKIKVPKGYTAPSPASPDGGEDEEE
jgi:RNA-binding protein